MHIGYWWESQKERDHQENQDIGGWAILKGILDRMWWYRLDRSGSRLRPVKGSCENVMNLRVPQNAGKFLSTRTIGGFSRRAQFHEVNLVNK
jgi:hypothetical protein